MDEPTANRFPKFRDYDFNSLDFSRGGEGTLLVPNAALGPTWRTAPNAYVPKDYGIGELRVAPYLQTHLNAGDIFHLKQLADELKGFDRRILLASTEIPDKPALLFRALGNFHLDGLVNLEQTNSSEGTTFPEQTLISPGPQYNDIRVFGVRPNAPAKKRWHFF
jgi:hypothetical protein